jgi:hypothetical protein
VSLGVKVLGIVYNAEDVPWCGVLVAKCLPAAKVDLSAMRYLTYTAKAASLSASGSLITRR